MGESYPVNVRLRDILLIAFACWFCGVAQTEGADKKDPAVTVKLQRGDFVVFAYVPVGSVKGAIIFGSGDGGWTYWERKTCEYLARQGWYVLGIDCQAYASSDYTQEILRQDYLTLYKFLSTKLGAPPEILFLGGYSMGAEQAIPTAAVLKKNLKIDGLILIGPGERGRYGLRLADRLGLTPSGDHTFALSDFATQLDSIPVLQIHGEHDPLDSMKWLKSLTTRHRTITVKDGWHNFHQADEAFLARLSEGVTWLTQPESKP